MRLSIALILGVLVNGLVALDEFLWIFFTGFILFFSSILLSQKFGFYRFRHLNGVLALALIFFTGWFITKLQYHEKEETHYTLRTQSVNGFSGVISGAISERKNHIRYEMKLMQMVSQDSLLNVTGKIHLYVKKDSSEHRLSYGDQINVYGSYFSIHPPSNPNEFDYKSYLARQHIYSQAFVASRDIQVIGNTSLNPIVEAGQKLRQAAIETIDKNILRPRENGIAKALILGVKDDLDNEVKQAYSTAGAMHVLAVSGLHVGIIYLIIKMIFGKLKLAGRIGKFAFGLICIAMIWLYAAITGFSPSVLRAATMFSVIVVGELNNRSGNVYNSLGIASFILVLFDPYIVYSVGFQLSFVAVIGIVYLQPKLYRTFEFQNVILDKCSSITCVSIAAQIATFPLSVHYFHQFPTYFLVSNLLVIPSSFLILTGGIIMLLVDPLIPLVGSFIGSLLQKLIWCLNESISLLLKLPGSLIDWIRLDSIEMILIYAIVITVLVGLHYGVFKTIIVSGLLILGLVFYNLQSHVYQSKKHTLIFYKLSDKLAIDHIQGHSVRLYTDSLNRSNGELLSYQINPFRLHSFLKPMNETLITFEQAGFQEKEVIRQGVIANQKFIIIDSTTFHLDFKDQIQTDYLIINNGSVKSLSWLAKHFDFKRLIISPNNSFYYSREMKRQARELGIKIHSLKADNALLIHLE